jgi:TetR/AcrR family transcriptional regulator, transcriptional repressor for nem operon
LRYAPGQRERAKKAILEAGAKAIKHHGINGIGVDGIAASAGVTSGAFYSNFEGKEAMLEAVIATYLGEFFVPPSESKPTERKRLLKEWIATYVSRVHREDSSAGCVMPSLSADVARAGNDVRKAYGRNITGLIGKLAGELTGKEAERERRAWSILAMLVGAISISRAMPDGHEADRALDAALLTALDLAGVKVSRETNGSA